MRYVTSFEKIVRAECRAEGQAHLLIRLLADKFGPVDPDTQAKIQRFDENRLFESAKRCLTAQTLHEALGQ